MVSIPQSGWWPFRQSNLLDVVDLEDGFNPPVGMVAVQADVLPVTVVGPDAVSIPQSGWWPFRLANSSASQIVSISVSIPQSGWWPFRQRRQAVMAVAEWFAFQSPSRDGGRSGTPILQGAWRGLGGFNPPVGMVAVQAAMWPVSNA